MATDRDDRADRGVRVVVGSTGDDAAARRVARALLMSGREVVFVGGDQTVEQLARTAQAEDAGSLVLDADDTDLARLRELLESLELSHVPVSPCDQPDAPDGGNSG